MKKIFILVGNGFTIDFINHYNEYCKKKDKVVDIDVRSLFKFGEKINTPWDKKPGFLSYKNCPALWTLGARPNQSVDESNALIEEIISCANMFFDFINDPDQKTKRLSMASSSENKIYLRAYSELTVYLRQLFSWYNSLIKNDELYNFVTECENWGWLDFLKNVKLDKFEKIVFVTYNYDIWLERILECLEIKYDVVGFTDQVANKIQIIKPHGSISFVPKNNIERYEINYNIDVEGLELGELKLEYENLTTYSSGAIIPPAGDASRLQATSSWATFLRKEAVKNAKEISSNKQNAVVMCGISYWHVDRKEIDELLINLNSEVDFTFINPSPPRDLNAVLISIFKNYVLQTTSDSIGDILNG